MLRCQLLWKNIWKIILNSGKTLPIWKWMSQQLPLILKCCQHSSIRVTKTITLLSKGIAVKSPITGMRRDSHPWVEASCLSTPDALVSSTSQSKLSDQTSKVIVQTTLAFYLWICFQIRCQAQNTRLKSSSASSWHEMRRSFTMAFRWVTHCIRARCKIWLDLNLRVSCSLVSRP